LGQKDVPSLKLTYPLKIDPWKRRFLLKTIIFRGYVSFRECKILLMGPKIRLTTKDDEDIP